MNYPCQWCGSCPVWLAAYEEGTGLDTEEKVIEACKKYYDCHLVGKKVEEPMKFRIYAGLSGGFGGAVYQGIYECRSQEEAEWKAYDIAVEEYESYGGNHGLTDWDGCYEDLLESEWIEPGAQSEEEIERMVDDHYREQVESWIVYKAVPVESSSTDFDIDDADYEDDTDCYCE